MTKGTGDGGVKRHHARTDLAPPGPGDSAPARTEPASGGPEGGVMATQAMPVSPGRHVSEADLLQPVDPGDPLVRDRPPTSEEVAPEEWPRRAVTPPPPPMPGNGVVAPITWQEINQTIAQQVTRAVEEALKQATKKFADIRAVNEAHAKEIDRIKTSLGDELVRLIDGRFGEFGRKLLESLDGRFRAAADQQAGDIGRVLGDISKARKDLGGEIAAIRTDVGSKASRVEVDSLSNDIGSLRGDIAASRETVEGLKGADDARREALDGLDRQVHELAGTMDTFKGRIKAVEEGVEEARGELEALRQADTGLNAEQTRLTARIRGIEQALEELKGAFRGIRDEALPEVRRSAARADQAAAAASAQVAELMPRLEYVEGLATKMRSLQNFMDRVEALERLYERYPGDIVEIATRLGLKELADELAGTPSKG